MIWVVPSVLSNYGGLKGLNNEQVRKNKFLFKNFAPIHIFDSNNSVMFIKNS